MLNDRDQRQSQLPARALQIVSSFTSTPIAQTLQPLVRTAGIADELLFSQYAQMMEYMLGAAVDSEHIVGTIVMVRVEDWLRDNLKSATPNSPSAHVQSVRQSLRIHVDEFVSHLATLSSRGKPVWFLACPSTGWICDRYQLEALCRTYTNLLAARVQNLPQMTVLDWPASLLSDEVHDRSSDRLGQVPFTLDAFDRLGQFMGQQVEHTFVRKSMSEAPTHSPRAPELAAYLAGLRVHVRLVRATAQDRRHVDRILRTAAAFSLQGEKRDLAETEVDALLESGNCVLISVSDRISNYGPSGVIAFRPVPDSLVVDSLSLSCTVLGKQVEYVTVAGLAQIASDRHCSKLVFEYKPSARNQPMLTFLGSIADADYVLSLSVVQQRLEEAAVAAGAWTLELDMHSVQPVKAL
jgi:hypothetical protein